MNDRTWNGRAVFVMEGGTIPTKPIVVALTTQGARTLIATLGRLTQTTIPLPGDAGELKQALEYVLSGDAASERAHRQMEAGKGMTPDGGHRLPEGSMLKERE